MELRLPAPCLLVLVGPSGAGKSTWAAEHFAANEVVASDSLRAMVGIDEDDQQASTVAFELLDRIVAERVDRGLTVVVDTTGLDPKRRRSWVALAHEAGLPAYAVLFDTPGPVCEERNALRRRPIPKSALKRQLGRFEAATEEIGAEGFDAVHEVQPIGLVAAGVAAVIEDRAPRTAPVGHTFGLLVSRFDWGKEASVGDRLASIATRAEAAGFRDFWVMDHFRQIRSVGREWEDIPEAYTALGYVAAVTSRIRVGALVTAITHRHPVVLGKVIATLDALSGGRAICGLGLAWDAEEHAAYGIPFPPTEHRYRLLEETLLMLPMLWGPGSPAFQGDLIQADALVCYPRPIQESIPIMIGGSGEKKTLRLVAEHADQCNLFGDPDNVRKKLAALSAHCADVGRDPASIEVTHLITAMAAESRTALRERIDRLRGRSTSIEQYAGRANAGTVDDMLGLFTAYADAGADHSIVALPDVHIDGSIEAFGEVITRMSHS